MTRIEWADKTVNVAPFCSNGCPFCYTQRLRPRMKCPDCRANRPHVHLDRLAEITKGSRKGPLRIFLNSMGDLFDPGMARSWYPPIWEAVAASPHHVIVLTKRPDLMTPDRLPAEVLPNLWLGVSVTRQTDLWRLDELLRRWRGRAIVSIEPLLGPVDIRKYLGFVHQDEIGADSGDPNDPWVPGLDWVIVGGLSGAWLPRGWSTRVSLLQSQAGWAADIADQCLAAGVPVFVKDEPVRLPSPAPEPRQYPVEMLRQPERRSLVRGRNTRP